MPHVAEPGWLTIALAVEASLRIGRARVGLVGTFLAMEVALRIAPWTIAVLVVPILTPEALERRPGLDQRPVHREMVARQQPLYPRLGQDGLQKLRRDLTFQQPIPVLGEARMVPRQIVHTQSHKPAEKQVEVYPLHQLTLRPDAVERLQQHGPKQSFRRDRWPPQPRRIKHRKLAVERRKRLVRYLPDHPQRMAPTNPCLKVNIRKQRS